jgi:hypothetical protein
MWNAWERRGKCTRFWMEIPKEKVYLEDDEIIMDLRDISCGDVEWIQLAQDRDRWRALESTVMNLRALAPRSQYANRISYTNFKMYYDQTNSDTTQFVAEYLLAN